MVFTKDSGLVTVYVSLVLNPNNNYTLESVPKLYNLREVVTEEVEKILAAQVM